MISIVTGVTLAMISTMWCPVMAAPQGRRKPVYTFMEDINKCLLHEWTSVLKGPVHCPGLQLCYNAMCESPAQFAVCFDLKKFIPQFTAHQLAWKGNSQEESDICNRGNWCNEKVKIELEEAPAQALSKICSSSDYKRQYQESLSYSWPSLKENYFARGHLTPCADFSTCAERKLTMINTNAAPQLQSFNNGNWRSVEEALREYTEKRQSSLYVFTGTGGSWLNGRNEPKKLNEKIVIPKNFWKVVCDPIGNESLAILGVNEEMTYQPEEVPTVGPTVFRIHNIKGVIDLYPVNDFKPDDMKSHLPLQELCNPYKLGESLKQEIENKLIRGKRPSSDQYEGNDPGHPFTKRRKYQNSSNAKSKRKREREANRNKGCQKNRKNKKGRERQNQEIENEFKRGKRHFPDQNKRDNCQKAKSKRKRGKRCKQKQRFPKKNQRNKN